MGRCDSEPKVAHGAFAMGLAMSQLPIPAGSSPRRCTDRHQPRATLGEHLPAQGCIGHRAESPVPRHMAPPRPPPPSSRRCRSPWLVLRGALAQEGSLSSLGGPEGMAAAPQCCEPRRGWCRQPGPTCGQELCWGRGCRAPEGRGVSCPLGACPAARAAHVTAGAAVAAEPCPMARGR